MKKILALIPARAGSKGIPNKNMYELNGKPLIQYTFDAVKKCNMITRAILSTDSIEYAEYARTQGIDAVIRPVELASDNTPMKDVIDFHLNELMAAGEYYDILLLLQPTSPLRTEKHIDEALTLLEKQSVADAVVSVIKVPHSFSPLKIMTRNENGFLNFYHPEGEQFTTRQELPDYYARNGAAIYAVYTESYRETKSLYGHYCIPFEMDAKDSVDIDSIDDLLMASWRLMQREKDLCS